PRRDRARTGRAAWPAATGSARGQPMRWARLAGTGTARQPAATCPLIVTRRSVSSSKTPTASDSVGPSEPDARTNVVSDVRALGTVDGETSNPAAPSASV